MNTQYFKTVDVVPCEILAGDSVEITIRLVAGPDFSAENTRIILDLPAYLGYTRPTRLDQELNGYITVLCSNPDINYIKRMWDMEIMDFPTKGRTSFNGMAQRLFVLDLLEGKAQEDDEILIKWGYTRDNYGVGTKVSTVVLKSEFYNTIHVRYFLDSTMGLPDLGRSFKGYERPKPDVEIPVSYRVLPREPEQMRIIHKQNKSYLLPLDRFGNISSQEDIHELIGEKISAEKNSYGVFEIKSPYIQLTSKKLPKYEAPSMENVYQGMNIYFGDLHTHSSVSNDCIEREKLDITPDGMFEYAKKVSVLDFLAITDHHQPWDIERNKIGESNWAIIQEAVRKYNCDGEFAAFAGLEFRCSRGDTAVIFNEVFNYNEIDICEMKDIRDLWRMFEGRDYITIPHFHNKGSLKDGEWYACPYDGVETLLEIYSCHGSYESDKVLERHIPENKPFRNDRHGKYFLGSGYRYGLTCNSDGHKGNPGRNGLTAVYATELTKDAIINAIRSRYVYGTTNARIRLLMTINGSLMGSVVKSAEKNSLYVSVQGERPFKAVDIIKDGELYQRFKPNEISFETEVSFENTNNSYWYVRATQIDNHIAYSSPIWME